MEGLPFQIEALKSELRDKREKHDSLLGELEVARRQLLDLKRDSGEQKIGKPDVRPKNSLVLYLAIGCCLLLGGWLLHAVGGWHFGASFLIPAIVAGAAFIFVSAGSVFPKSGGRAIPLRIEFKELQIDSLESRIAEVASAVVMMEREVSRYGFSNPS